MMSRLTLPPHLSPASSGSPRCPTPRPVGRAALTFAVCDVGGAVEVRAGVSRTGDAVVLAELGLVGANGAADAAVGGGVVVVAGGAVYCRGGKRSGGHSPWGSLPSMADSAEFKALPHLWVTSCHPCPGPERADPLLLDTLHDRAGCSGDHGGLSEPGRPSPVPGPAP